VAVHRREAQLVDGVSVPENKQRIDVGEQKKNKTNKRTEE
jgi:hypothetical protein